MTDLRMVVKDRLQAVEENRESMTYGVCTYEDKRFNWQWHINKRTNLYILKLLYYIHKHQVLFDLDHGDSIICQALSDDLEMASLFLSKHHLMERRYFPSSPVIENIEL